MKVQDVMTREVVSCHADTDVGAAARQMLDGHFGTIPVVDAHGRLTGILTDRDIAMAAATRARNASHIAVHEAMRTDIRVCSPQDELDAALGRMAAACVRRLPVVDAAGRLSGVLSIDDIAVRGVGGAGGITPEVFVAAMRRLCSRSPVEPDVDLAELQTPG